MAEFKYFKLAVQKQFASMIANNSELFVTDVSKDVMWDTYLGSFPEGTNPIFRERTEYDCQCCKSFIRTCGNVVSIVDNKLVSIWDIEVDGYFQVVANALSNLVKLKLISDMFLHFENKVGTDFNLQTTENASIRWEHFYLQVPAKFVKLEDRIGTTLSDKRAGKEVFKRALKLCPDNMCTSSIIYILNCPLVGKY